MKKFIYFKQIWTIQPAEVPDCVPFFIEIYKKGFVEGFMFGESANKGFRSNFGTVPSQKVNTGIAFFVSWNIKIKICKTTVLSIFRLNWNRINGSVVLQSNLMKVFSMLCMLRAETHGFQKRCSIGKKPDGCGWKKFPPLRLMKTAFKSFCGIEQLFVSS